MRYDFAWTEAENKLFFNMKQFQLSTTINQEKSIPR